MPGHVLDTTLTRMPTSGWKNVMVLIFSTFTEGGRAVSGVTDQCMRSIDCCSFLMLERIMTKNIKDENGGVRASIVNALVSMC